VFTSKNVEMGETRIRCPKCGSGNIIGYEGEYECMDCGYSFFIKKGGLTSFPAKRIPEEPLKKVERTKRASALICILIICFLICGYIGYCIGVNVSQVSTLLLTKTKTEFFEITKLPPRRIDFGITKMKINDTHLTIEQARRGFDNIYIKGITAKNLAYYPSIFIDHVFERDLSRIYEVEEKMKMFAVADYVLISENLSVISISFKKVVPSGKMYIYIDGPNKFCEILYNDEGFVGFGNCFNAKMSLGKQPIKLVFDYINSTSIEYLSEYFLNRTKLTDINEFGSFILDWFEKNVKPCHDKNPYVTYDPTTFFNLRKGVCRDYAVFTAAALIASGFREASFIYFMTDAGGHVTAAVEINGTLFIIDGALRVRSENFPKELSNELRLGLIEWSDYQQYVFANSHLKAPILLVKVSMEDKLPRIELHNYDDLDEFNKKYSDSYPFDETPAEILFESLKRAANKTGARFFSNCVDLYRQARDAGVGTSLPFDRFRMFYVYNPVIRKYIEREFERILIEKIKQFESENNVTVAYVCYDPCHERYLGAYDGLERTIGFEIFGRRPSS